MTPEHMTKKVMRGKIRGMLKNPEIMEVRMVRFDKDGHVDAVRSYHLDTEYRKRKFVYKGNIDKTIVSWDGESVSMEGIIYETVENPSAS